MSDACYRARVNGSCEMFHDELGRHAPAPRHSGCGNAECCRVCSSADLSYPFMCQGEPIGGCPHAPLFEAWCDLCEIGIESGIEEVVDRFNRKHGHWR